MQGLFVPLDKLPHSFRASAAVVGFGIEIHSLGSLGCFVVPASLRVIDLCHVGVPLVFDPVVEVGPTGAIAGSKHPRGREVVSGGLLVVSEVESVVILGLAFPLGEQIGECGLCVVEF